jgi:hypothetical protein
MQHVKAVLVLPIASQFFEGTWGPDLFVFRACVFFFLGFTMGVSHTFDE